MKREQAKFHPLISVLLVVLAPAAAQLVQAQSAIVNPQALTGTWYNPKTSGQGFVFDVASNADGTANIFGGWFTFITPDLLGIRAPLWFTLQGRIGDANSDNLLPLYVTSGGGQFDAPPATHAVQVGTATLRFSDCTHATLAYSLTDTKSIIPYFDPAPVTGSIPLTRLTADSSGCSQPAPNTKSSRGFSGTWYNPATSGQGFILEISPQTAGGLLFGGWFTYNSNGPSWYTLQGAFAPTAAKAAVPVYTSPDGVFDTAGVRYPAVQAGSAQVEFTSCTEATITYTLNYFTPARSGTIPIKRLTSVPADCSL